MGRGKTIRELKKSLPEQCFWVHEGPILSDLIELKDALLNDMTDEQYNHHVNIDEGKSDFADWVQNILKDKHCATELRTAKKRKTAARRIEKCLKRY